MMSFASGNHLLRDGAGSDSTSGTLAATPLLGGREPVLPVHTRKRSANCHLVHHVPQHTFYGCWKSRCRSNCSKRSSRGVFGKALLLTALTLLAGALAALVSGAAVGLYALSIIHEPAAPQAAAARQVKAASAALAGVGSSSALATARRHAAEAAEPSPATNSSSGYTVVVMSYAKRSATLPMVINKLGSCPSVAEVLLVWNGGAPPSTLLFNTRAPVRIRPEPKNDLSNRLRADPGITTQAVLLADDDILLRCADIERGFATWQANRQAIVGFFPRLLDAGPPPQYLPEKTVFRSRRYNAMLTAAEFVSIDLLRLYWSERYAQARALVSELTNCEDILLNFVAATAVREAAAGAQTPLVSGGQGDSSRQTATPMSGSDDDEEAGAGNLQQARGQQQAQPEAQRQAQQAPQEQEQAQLPHVVWAQPSRRMDLSFLSGVGISRSNTHMVKRRHCVGQFSEWYGSHLLQPQTVAWSDDTSNTGRFFSRPLCSFPFMGCVYL